MLLGRGDSTPLPGRGAFPWAPQPWFMAATGLGRASLLWDSVKPGKEHVMEMRQVEK